MPEERIDEIRHTIRQKLIEIEHARVEDNFPPKESHLCDYCVYYELCPAKRHKLALDEGAAEEFDPEAGRDLADRYLELNEEKKKIDSEMRALKDDIVKFCEQMELTRLDSDRGNVKITTQETEEFPPGQLVIHGLCLLGGKRGGRVPCPPRLALSGWFAE